MKHVGSISDVETENCAKFYFISIPRSYISRNTQFERFWNLQIHNLQTTWTWVIFIVFADFASPHGAWHLVKISWSYTQYFRGRYYTANPHPPIYLQAYVKPFICKLWKNAYRILDILQTALLGSSIYQVFPTVSTHKQHRHKQQRQRLSSYFSSI